ncbi:TPA: DUF932 domain-containing protein [Campylobacter lari]|nr:DUF932 domain-containing protein [Campylobacter lari]
MKIFNEALSNKQLMELAPSLFANEPYFETSDKYHFISTIDVIETIRKHLWYPVAVSEVNVRNKEKDGFQKHCVRFRHLDDLLQPGENSVELLLFNSHDRSKSFSISLGVFRFACANGLVIADEIFDSYHIRHLGKIDNDVSSAIKRIAKVKQQILDKIDLFSKIELSKDDKASFAKAAIQLRFENHLYVDYNALLIPHRAEDEKDDLYTTLNIIQEHLIRGNLRGVNKQTNRCFTSREIKSIDTNTQINQRLWSLGENMAKIKST